MSKRTKRTAWAAGVAAFILFWGALFAARVMTPPGGPAARSIVLEARDAAFLDRGSENAQRNPRIEVEAGERIRLVIRNTDPGVAHAISLPGLDAEVRLLHPGDEVAVELQAMTPGTYEYVCPFHVPLMKGSLVVRPKD